MTQPVSSALPTRTCIGCGRDLPLDQFPIRVVGHPARRSKCRPCLAKYMRTYRAGKRSRSLRQVTSALAQAETHAKAETLLAQGYRHFGGVHGFAREWFAQYDAARSQAPGSRLVLNTLIAIARLGEVAEASLPKRDVSQFSDEELEQDLQDHTLQYLLAHPEIVLCAARRLGWSVVPPSSS